MNDMLAGVDWMSTIKPDDDDYVAAHIDWLTTAGPEDWHRAALDFNWTNRLEPLLWIVMQDDCELATALNIFWRCEPGWDLMLMVKGEQVDERDEMAIVGCIADRINAGSYTRRTIAFEAEPGMQADYEEMEGYCTRIAKPPFSMHPDMIRSIGGHKVDNDKALYQRYPQVFHGTVWAEWDDDEAGDDDGGSAPVVRAVRSQPVEPDGPAAPSMLDDATDALDSALLNLGIFGLAAGLLPLVEWQGTRVMIGGVLLVAGLAFGVRNVAVALRRFRAAMTGHPAAPSSAVLAILGLAAVGVGFGLLRLALQGHLQLTGRGIVSDPSGYGKSIAVGLAFAALWGLSTAAARSLTRRFARA